jgi:hypothetical protein
MLCVAMKRTPAESYGRFAPTPFAVFTDIVRCAWYRVVERVNSDRCLLEQATIYSGDLDSLLIRHAERHGRHQNGSLRVFRAPVLVYDPPVRMWPVRERRFAAVSFVGASKTGHDPSWSLTR